MSVLALFALLILAGFIWGTRCTRERMQKLVDEEARHRAATERAFDKLWARYIAARAQLMADMDPWANMRHEIASLPEKRDYVA